MDWKRKGIDIMKVAYIFSTSGHTASYKLGKMILPQLEERRHGAEIVGMMLLVCIARAIYISPCFCPLAGASFAIKPFPL
jgi:hypothetical protein